jgi:diguanylate cyclase (GGDEF)-like protein
MGRANVPLLSRGAARDRGRRAFALLDSPGVKTSAASAVAAAPIDESRGLDLDAALLLLQHSGRSLPQGAPVGSDAWLQALIDGLCEISSRDPLTGLANRRSFELELQRELDRVARAGESALVLMLDIDHFKRVNDRHGHGAGDMVLKAVARALVDSVRPMDTVARFGGEEFAIILPNCPPAFGEAVAERVRHTIERRSIAIAPGQSLHVTASLGGAFAPQWVRSSAALWIERADRQLYRAKASGRNRACLEQTLASQVSAEEKGLLFGTSQFQDLLL